MKQPQALEPASSLSANASIEPGDEGPASMAKLLEAAKDENELLEFKNYELQFKIQELEMNQRRILSAICNNVTTNLAPALLNAEGANSKTANELDPTVSSAQCRHP